MTSVGLDRASGEQSCAAEDHAEAPDMDIAAALA
jgi:hypothetical protein